MRFKKANLFTIFAGSIALIVSMLGTFLNNLYNDNEFVRAIWQGNDIVTGFIVVPLMFWSMKKVSEGGKSKRSFLIWLGCLWYLIYNYVFYVYGAAFSVFFLPYTAIIISSVLAMFFALTLIDVGNFLEKVKTEASIKSVRVFLYIFAILLGGAWIAMASTYFFTGEVPTAIVQTGHPTGVVFATDLIFLISPLFILTLYLKSKKPWALILTPVILIKCCLYPMVLIVAGIITYMKIGVYDVLTPAYLILGAGAAMALRRMLKVIGV
ncbi:hypothetical protein [Clostridium vincentii]|uniref:Uncharacterized protein n=1 Tax=Clostridium vincentii TaxID=52704 RepID=A0A2T0BDY7_9CLOT|nr:hypothetical protein [Clostridium vincentii]PRR82106.1 hypothetical protein CLVI_20410 [Clostridium vincentii]